MARNTQAVIVTRDQIIATLREHQSRLSTGGIERLFLFGSHSRGTAVPHLSDIDLMADFSGGRRLTLLDKAGLEVELAELLQTSVDLCDRSMLLEPVRENAEREAVLVF